jgi:coproporphyrinogen III oxidase
MMTTTYSPSTLSLSASELASALDQVGHAPVSTRAKAETIMREAQHSICKAFADLDGASFAEDVWTSPDGNTTYTDKELRNGNVFQTVSSNVAVINGVFSPDTARAATGGSLQIDSPMPFYVASLSLVVHARNPMVPSAHANYRYFDSGQDDVPERWWFGGGADLTPNYLFEEDAAHFHRLHREVCDRFDLAYYPRFKNWCDEYFHIVHRGERRGVGGIFFDNLSDRDPELLLAFVAQCAASVIPAYLPIVRKRCSMDFTEEQERWRQLRAGRYIEFNLMYERGTVFGLKSGGRAASVLRALPPRARWEYQHTVQAGSDEARLMEVLRHPCEWA